MDVISVPVCQHVTERADEANRSLFTSMDTLNRHCPVFKQSNPLGKQRGLASSWVTISP